MGAYRRHELEDLQADRMLLILQDLIHLTVLVEEEHEAEDLAAVGDVVLDGLRTGDAQHLLLSMTGGYGGRLT